VESKKLKYAGKMAEKMTLLSASCKEQLRVKNVFGNLDDTSPLHTNKDEKIVVYLDQPDGRFRICTIHCNNLAQSSLVLQVLFRSCLETIHAEDAM
jgi:hypothetical protein